MAMALSLRFVHMRSLNGFGHTGAKGLTCCNPLMVRKLHYSVWEVHLNFNDQLFKGRLALNPGLNLTTVSFSSVQKHFLGYFSPLFLRAFNLELVDKKN